MAGKVSPGDPLRISASDWNGMLDLVAAGKLDQVGGTIPSWPGSTQVLIRNTTGSDLDRFHVCGISDPLFLPTDDLNSFKNQIAFRGLTPTVSHTGKFAVVQQPIPYGKLGVAVISGLTVAQITFVHTTHDRADIPAEGGTLLATSYYGSAEILYTQSGSGTRWAVLRIGSFVAPVVKAKANGTILPGSSGSVTVYRNGSATTAVTAHLNWLDGGEPVSNGDELLIRYFRDEAKWVIIGAECPQ